MIHSAHPGCRFGRRQRIIRGEKTTFRRPRDSPLPHQIDCNFRPDSPISLDARDTNSVRLKQKFSYPFPHSRTGENFAEPLTHVNGNRTIFFSRNDGIFWRAKNGFPPDSKLFRACCICWDSKCDWSPPAGDHSTGNPASQSKIRLTANKSGCVCILVCTRPPNIVTRSICREIK